LTPEQQRLPRRDWIILPLLSLLTVGLLTGVSEVAARLLWSEQLVDSCGVADPVFGLHFKPNCRSEVKSAESPWLENAYNGCGFRTAEDCGPKAANQVRVAVVGSSISSGYLVPYPRTFTAQATEMLRRRCHAPVDFQNLGVPGGGQIEKVPLHLDAALGLHPNMVLMVISEFDLQSLQAPVAAAAAAKTSVQAAAAGTAAAAAGTAAAAAGTAAADAGPGDGKAAAPAVPGPTGLGEEIRQIVVKLRASRAVLVAQHFLFENIDAYLPLYLQHGDEADYLRPPLSPAWRRRLDQFDQEIGEIASRTGAEQTPFMLVYLPSRAQAALMHWKNRPAGIDPALLGQDLGVIARRHGIDYLDLTETIADHADPAGLYYPEDSHPNAAAGGIIADAIVSGMLARDRLPAACHDTAQVRN
jgi:hypothetical protein